jgi:hypothetical protein
VYQNIAGTYKQKKNSIIGSHVQSKDGKQKKASQNRLARKYKKQKKSQQGWHVHTNMESVHTYSSEKKSPIGNTDPTSWPKCVIGILDVFLGRLLGVNEYISIKN